MKANEPEQYIKKSVLVAEIEKRQKEEISYDENGSFASWADQNHYSTLESLKNYVNTLEVKEVDLEEELESFAYTLPHSAIGDGEHLGKFDDQRVKEARKHGWSHLWRYNYVKEIAKHFFELGLKAQKGE